MADGMTQDQQIDLIERLKRAEADYAAIAEALGCVHHHPHGGHDAPGTRLDLLVAIKALSDRAEDAESRADRLQRELDEIRDAMKADPNEADLLEAISEKLGTGTAEGLHFSRFRRDYYLALRTCDMANEIIVPVAETLRVMEPMQSRADIEDIPWFTKTLSGVATRVLLRQYSEFVRANGGVNYVQLAFGDDDGRAIRIIICHPDGKGPHELREQAESERDEAIARAEAAELALAEVDMIIGVVGADRDCRRMLLCSDRERMRAAERERDARPPITPEMAAARDHITAARCAGNTVPAHLYNLAARADDALRAHAAKAVL